MVRFRHGRAWYSVTIAKRTVVLDLPDGVTVSDAYVREYEVGIQTVDKPLNSQVSGIPEGFEIDGWYYNGVLYNGKTKMPAEGMTLELRLKKAELKITFNIFVSNSNVGYNGYTPIKTAEYGDVLTLPKRDQLKGIADDARLEWYVNNALFEGDSVTVKSAVTVKLKVFVKAKLDLPAGISIADGVFADEYEAGTKMTVVGLSEHVVRTGDETRELQDWYYYSHLGAPVKADKYAAIPASGFVLTATFKPLGTPLTPSQNANRDTPDKFGTYSEDHKTFTPRSDDNFSVGSAIVSGESGITLSFVGTMNVRDGFRMNTAAANKVDASKHYHVWYRLVNSGDAELVFDLYKINSQTDILSSATSVKYPDTIRLASGEKLDPAVDIFGYGNNNLLTMIVMRAAVRKRYGETFAMPNENVTVAPYFIADGFRRMWYADGKKEGRHDNVKLLDVNNFTVLRDPISGNDPSIYGFIKEEFKTVVGGGADGFAQQGVLVEYTGDMPVGAQFRNSSVVNDKSYTSGSQFKLEKGKTYTYTFNIENKGDNAICLKVWLVNSGVDTSSTGGENGFEIRLAKGESMAITRAVSYTGGGATNDNANILFEALETSDGQGMTGMKMGIAMSIEIPNA